MAKLTTGNVCRKSVASDAERCPHCGTDEPGYRSPADARLSRISELVARFGLELDKSDFWDFTIRNPKLVIYRFAERIVHRSGEDNRTYSQADIDAPRT